MNDEHILDELSGYIDGEVVERDRIARHLNACPSCARRYRELLALSAGLKGLRAPEVSPAFLTRVMAGVREAGPVTPHRRGWRWWPSLVAASAVVAVAASVFFLSHKPAPSPDPAATVARFVSPEAEADPLFASAAFPGADDSDDPTDDDMEEVLASTDWFDALAATVDESQDVSELVTQLTPDEDRMLRQLLVEYAKEGTTS